MAVRLIDVNDIIQFTIATNHDSQQCLNVLHYVCRNAPSLGETYVEQMTTILANFTTELGQVINLMSLAMSQDALISEVTAQVISPSRLPYVLTGVAVGGQIPTAALPSVCSAQITKRSEATARGKAGHFALTGVPAAEVTDGVLQADYRFGVLQDLADGLEDELNYGASGDFTPGIYVTDGSGTINPILQCVTQPEVRAMTRRVVNRGI